MAGFDHPWYAEIIQRFHYDTTAEDTPNASIDGLGQSVVVAACIVSQTIDQHTEALKEIARAIRLLAESKTSAGEE